MVSVKFKNNRTRTEYFIQKTIELTDLAMDPIQFKSNSNNDKQTNYTDSFK